MLTVAVIQQKGGVGKSTLAIQLAAAAHLDGLRALIIDMDKQATAFDWSAQRPEGSPLEGIAVVQAVMRESDRALEFVRHIPEISRGRDVVFLDVPARLDKITITAALAADVALIPLQSFGPDFWAVAETLESLDAADHHRRHPIRRAFVLNRAIVGTTSARDAEESLRAQGGELIGVVHQRVGIGDTITRGASVMTTAGNAEAAEEIRRLWRAIKRGTNGSPRTQHQKAKPRARKADPSRRRDGAPAR